MDPGDAALPAWEERLRRAEEELREREERALADDPSPGEMLALAAERDKIATDRHTVAELYGERSDSPDDRSRSRRARDHAAADRERAADLRGRAALEAAKQQHHLDGLRIALESRLVIGRAEGILMQRHNISCESAFAVLARFSQESNRKLRDVAAELVAAADKDCV